MTIANEALEQAIAIRDDLDRMDQDELEREISVLVQLLDEFVVESHARDVDPQNAEMAEQLDELLIRLESLDAEDIFAVAAVVATKREVYWPNGQQSNGITWRYLTESLEGVEEPRSVISMAKDFDGALDGVKLLTDHQHPLLGVLTADGG